MCWVRVCSSMCLLEHLYVCARMCACVCMCNDWGEEGGRVESAQSSVCVCACIRDFIRWCALYASIMKSVCAHAHP